MYQSSLVPVPESTSVYTKKFLTIGEIYLAESPTYIWTVLGSCVSIVLHNPRLKVSALCHAQLAEYVDVENRTLKYSLNGSSASKTDFRFVGTSFDYMLDTFLSMGIKKGEIYTSIFCGAHVIPNFTQNIGSDNVNLALSLIQKNGLVLINKDVGGLKSRTIYHHSDTGLTKVRFL